jgi:hypothetical protein
MNRRNVVILINDSSNAILSSERSYREANMCDLILSAHEISDLLQYDKRDVLDELIASAREAVLAGHTVIIRKNCGNAPPQDIKTFATIEDIDAWIEDIDLLDDINAIKKR